MTDFELQSLVIGTFVLILVFGFVLLLLLSYQKRILKKNKDLFLAVMHSQEQEQQRIGRDLHDSISPLISAVRLRAGTIELMLEEGRLDVAEEFKKLDELLANSGQVLREASHNLMPASLHSGLERMIEDFIAGFSHPSIQIQLFSRNFPEVHQEYAVLNIYRIVQELAQNALKYSQGSRISVYLFSFNLTNMQVIVRDNGVGMLTGLDNAKGIGYQNIDNRVKLLEGSYLICPSRSGGHRVHLKFDVKKWN